MSLQKQIEVPAKALVVPAHPDDAELWAGATIAKWARLGCDISYLVVTDGSKGSWDPSVDPEELAATRRSEQEKAAQILGASRPHFLGIEDGTAEADVTLRALVAEWIRRLAPEVVVTHDPWKPYLLHPDHRAVGTVVCDAVVAARDPLYRLPDAGESGADGRSSVRLAHRPKWILLWDPGDADHFEAVTEDDYATKIRALFAHESQYESTMGHTGPETAEAAEFIALRRALDVGTDTSPAEAFKVLDASG